MKCITLLQPWADLVVCGHKPVENRTWDTAHRGPLLIHAGRKRRGFRDARASMPRQFKNLLRDKAEYEYGAIVGMVELVGVYWFGRDDACSPWATGPYCWRLIRPVEFSQPIPFRGQQGLFDVPDDRLTRAIRRRHPVC